MVTGSEAIGSAKKHQQRKETEAVPFYAQQGFWDVIFQALELTANVLSSYNKPVAVKALTAVLQATRRETLNKNALHIKLTSEIQRLTYILTNIDRNEDPIEYSKVDGQLEMVMEMLSFLGNVNA